MRNMNKVFLETVDSTNTYAKKNAANLPMPSLIVANSQTAGRGRQGKSFFSPKDTGLYMTCVFPAPSNCDLLTPAAAVAVCEALEKLGVTPAIKWVNDVFAGGHKVCGILTECFSCGGKLYIALGIGINLTTAKFPDGLDIAGSVNVECDKKALAEEIAETILEYAENPDDGHILKEYEKRLFVIGRDITYIKDNKEYSATVEGINGHCNLIVKRADGSEDILSSGEISIKL